MPYSPETMNSNHPARTAKLVESLFHSLGVLGPLTEKFRFPYIEPKVGTKPQVAGNGQKIGAIILPETEDLVIRLICLQLYVISGFQSRC